ILELDVQGGLAEADRIAAIEARQHALTDALGASGFQLRRRFRHAPALAGSVASAALPSLGALPGVRAVRADPRVRAALAESVPPIHADAGSVHGLSGKGVRVAVLDTGVDGDHPDLAGAVVAQHCFAFQACAPNKTDEGTLANDVAGHGTWVAG